MKKGGGFEVVVSSLLWIWLTCLWWELSDSLNEEERALQVFKGRIEVDPYGALANWDEDKVDSCSWFGVQCSDDGRVLVLNLKDRSLKGTLAPDISKLKHLNTLILHNNSFYGVVPVGIGQLQKLEVLDLGHNKFSGLLPPDLGDIVSLKILILGGNKFASNFSPVMRKLKILPVQDDKETLPSNREVNSRKWRLLARELVQSAHPSPSPDSLSPPHPPPRQSHSKTHVVILLSTVGSVCFLIVISLIYLYYKHAKKVVVMPLTGLLTKGSKPSLRRLLAVRRSELEAACEDFSNIVGSFTNFTLYKGTLSSGVEVAVTSTLITSAKDWLAQDETQFRKKVSALSNFNHDNFMNLLGHCNENEPFTRMLLFEYAPNGTLFEHLHIKEVEQLNWSVRLRIAAGVAYCLEQMMQLNSPILRNLNSSSIYLTEDYAAKVSDLEFWSKQQEADVASEGSNENNIVYKFGIVLLEIISGRLPYSEDDGLLVLWASSYLNGSRPITDMVDETLNSVPEEDIIGLTVIIKSCINDDPEKRPTMIEVSSQMRLITAISPEVACPKLSPLWWAELQIVSSDVQLAA